MVWGTLDDENIVWGTQCGGACENIVWGTLDAVENIVWGTIDEGENIVWGTSDDGENIVWGTLDDLENIVWGTNCGGGDCENIVWGTAMNLENIVWGTALDDENIVWGTSSVINDLIWGLAAGGEDVTWGSSGEDADLFDAPNADPIVYDGVLLEDIFAPPPPSTTARRQFVRFGHRQPRRHSGRGLLMEKMPFRDAQEVVDVHAVMASAAQAVTTSDWRQSLPVLTGSMVTLRELRLSDAPSLLAMLSTEEVARFISPPPTTVEGFERFIAWTHRERAAGNYICFAVVPTNMDTAIGIFQVRQLEPGFGTAEWGFALGSAFWGSGVFHRRRDSRRRLRVRHRRRAAPRGARGDGERTRQRRAAEGRRRAGRCAAQVLPARRRVPGSDPVDAARRRLAPGALFMEADDPLIRA